MKKFMVLTAAALLAVSCATTGKKMVESPAAPQQVSGDIQVFKKADLETWNRENVAGGKGTLAGKFAFTRNDADPAWVLREIGWMTLKPGDSIGLHGHTDNDDTYIIISGTGEFTDTAGKTVQVAAKDITIAHPGQKHGLKNTGSTDLVFLDVVSKPVANPDPSWASEPQVFKAADLKTWDRENLAGGKGVLAGKYSFNRTENKTFPIYEIVWITMAPGTSAGKHPHVDNEDAYIIVSGTGEFIDTNDKVSAIGEGDIMMARAGQSHGLANTGATDLVFLDIFGK
jgi:mannose-6-phosphate isomerase-like protein (cupin superfamily)